MPINKDRSLSLGNWRRVGFGLMTLHVMIIARYVVNRCNYLFRLLLHDCNVTSYRSSVLQVHLIILLFSSHMEYHSMTHYFLQLSLHLSFLSGMFHIIFVTCVRQLARNHGEPRFLISWLVCVPDMTVKCKRLLVNHGLLLQFRTVSSRCVHVCDLFDWLILP